jgi:hypothetical protein
MRAAPLFLLLAACSTPAANEAKEAEEGADGGGTDGATDGGSGEGIVDIEDYPYKGWVNGDVTVTLFREDEDGNRSTVTWEESGYDTYPFGPIFVGSYTVPTSTSPNPTYAGTTLIESPTIEPSPFQMRVGAQEETSILVYAAVDVLGDGVIGADDPRGAWPVELPLTDGVEHDDVHIEILAMEQSEVTCADTGTITITGTVTVNMDYFGGNVGIMLVGEDGSGPYHVTTVQPRTTGAGSSATYSLEVCADYGPMRLVAAWDSNQNQLYDPNDKWGVYTLDHEADANPVFVGNANMNNYPIDIPLGDRPGVQVLSFARISGTVQMDAGTFSDLPSGSDVWVVGMAYRPDREFDVNDAAVTLSAKKFAWSEISSAAAKDWELLVPANTTIYLWAYADTDADGMLNEHGEGVGAASGDGRIPTGEGFGGIELRIAFVEE